MKVFQGVLTHCLFCVVVSLGHCKESHVWFPSNPPRQLAGTQTEVHWRSTAGVNRSSGVTMLLCLKNEERLVYWTKATLSELLTSAITYFLLMKDILQNSICFGRLIITWSCCSSFWYAGSDVREMPTSRYVFPPPQVGHAILTSGFEKTRYWSPVKLLLCVNCVTLWFSVSHAIPSSAQWRAMVSCFGKQGITKCNFLEDQILNYELSIIAILTAIRF